MTVYYLAKLGSGALKPGEITAFKKGFRMITGMLRSLARQPHPNLIGYNLLIDMPRQSNLQDENRGRKVPTINVHMLREHEHAHK